MSIEVLLQDFTEATKEHTAALRENTKFLAAFTALPNTAAPAATAAKDAPVPAANNAERVVERAEPPVRAAASAFIKEVSDSREKMSGRAQFLGTIRAHFKAERTEDIPEKNLPKIERWMAIYRKNESGDRIDFDVD